MQHTMPERLSSFLNAARWIAALAVVVSHVRHLLLVDLVDVERPTLVVKAFYFLTGFGHEAVIVFFVISGYLVGGLTLLRLPERGFDLVDFGINRFSRIYSVLVPALLVGGLLDLAGLTWWNASAIYAGLPAAPNASLDFAVADNLGWLTLLGNLAMTEGFAVSRLGSNAPLWSLVYEWWYYCLFAAALAGFMARTGLGRLASVVALVAMVVVLPAQVLLWGIVWLLGVATCLLVARRAVRVPQWVGLALLSAVLVVVRLSHSSQHSADVSTMQQFARDLALGLGFCLAIAGYAREGRALPLAWLHHRLAGFSYSLYLTHFPMLILLVAVAHDRLGAPFPQQPGWGALAYLTAVTAALVLYGWLFSRLTEMHTPRIRAWLGRQVIPLRRQ